MRGRPSTCRKLTKHFRSHPIHRGASLQANQIDDPSNVIFVIEKIPDDLAPCQDYSDTATDPKQRGASCASHHSVVCETPAGVMAHRQQQPIEKWPKLFYSLWHILQVSCCISGPRLRTATCDDRLDEEHGRCKQISAPADEGKNNHGKVTWY
jgi:hypothetical protein